MKCIYGSNETELIEYLVLTVFYIYIRLLYETLSDTLLAEKYMCFICYDFLNIVAWAQADWNVDFI